MEIDYSVYQGQIKSYDFSQNPKCLIDIANWIKTSDYAAQLDGTVFIRRLLSLASNPPIDAVVQSGAAETLVKFLDPYASAPELQFESAWAITNIASGNTNHVQYLISLGTVEAMIKLGYSHTGDVVEQAVWALGNITGESPMYRDIVLRAGGMTLMVHILRSSALSLTPNLMRNTTWTVSNLVRGKPQPPLSLVKDCIPLLAQLLHHPDEEVIVDACWALSYLSDGIDPKILLVLESGMAHSLVELLGHTSPTVLSPALRAVGNIVTGDDFETQALILSHPRLLPLLAQILDSPRRLLQKEACWTISNITAGNVTHKQLVVDAGLIPKLKERIMEAEFDVKKEAAWALSNLTNGASRGQLRCLIDNDCVPAFCLMLNLRDPSVIDISLEALENILNYADSEEEILEVTSKIEDIGGLESLQNLEEHTKPEIFERATKLLSFWESRRSPNE